MLKTDKTLYKNIGIYYIGYITTKKIDDYESIYSVNSLYLRINHARRSIEEKNGNKYLVFDSVDENKEVAKKYEDVWDGIKSKIKPINGDKENDYEKDNMKIAIKQTAKIYAMTIIIRSVSEEDGKLYPQPILDDTLYVLV